MLGFIVKESNHDVGPHHESEVRDAMVEWRQPCKEDALCGGLMVIVYSACVQEENLFKIQYNPTSEK